MSKADRRDKWLKRLADEDKAHAGWRKRAKTADEAYCSYKSDETGPLFPVFTTTVKTIHGRIYGQPPKPDVRKRHPSGAQPQNASAVPPAPSQQPPLPSGTPAGGMPGMAAVQGQVPPQAGSPVGGAPQTSQGVNATADDNTIAMCIERSLAYTIDTTLFDRDAHLAVNDFLIAGLGNCKVELETEIEMIPVLHPMTQVPLMDEEGQPLEQAQITYQCLHLRHFHWSQFRWEPCKDWRQCNWVAFDHYMTKEDIEDQFKVDLGDASPGEGSTKNGLEATGAPPLARNKYEGTFTVHEIWDKRTKKRLWITDAYEKALDEEEDPLKLKDFFPCPAPMMANMSGTEMLPSPDYHEYESLARHANTLSKRIYEITKQVKDIAFYDKSFGDLKKIESYPDGSFIAVDQLLDKLRVMGGAATTQNIICQVDMQQKVGVLQQLTDQLAETKARIYEINGIADIQRGVSNPDDTATAQNIKNQWADIRTGQRVQVVALFFRDVFRIMAQIIAQHFDPPQIAAMSGIELSPEQLATMRSDLATSYAVDVESDSTMVQNDALQQEQAMHFVQAFSGILQQMLPAVQAGSLPADIAKEIILMVKDAFKAGRQLEQAVNALPDTLQQLQRLTQQSQQAQQHAQQLQQQNQQLVQKLQQVNAGKEQRENIKTQADVQLTQADTQHRQAETQVLAPDAVKRAAEASMVQRQDILQGLTTGMQ
jgi:hypothetical protein